MRSAGHVVCVGEIRNSYRILVGKSEGRTLGRTRRRGEGNVRMNLREIEKENVDWIQLFQNTDEWQDLVNTVMKLLISQKAENFLIA
jgi:hypothetical protein